jgi:hypothetical protein
MGSAFGKSVPEAAYAWTYRAKSFFKDTTPIVSGDGSTVALYSRGERLIHVLNGRDGSRVQSIVCKQKFVIGNVSAIPSLSNDGSRLVTRDSNSVLCYDTRTGALLWEYERADKVVRSGMESWIAQISGDGQVVVVRMFHDMVVLSGDDGRVLMTTTHGNEMANSIPRVSDDGSTIVVADGPTLLGYVNLLPAWSAANPVTGAASLMWGDWWGDPAVSGDGTVCAAVAGTTACLFNAKTGAKLGEIPGVRHRHVENSNEVALSHVRALCCVVLFCVQCCVAASCRRRVGLGWMVVVVVAAAVVVVVLVVVVLVVLLLVVVAVVVVVVMVMVVVDVVVVAVVVVVVVVAVVAVLLIMEVCGMVCLSRLTAY